MQLQKFKYLLGEKTEFKTFKELCDHLGEDYNGQTNSRKALEKKFRQFFEFEKVKGTNKIVVTEVFDKMKPNFKSKGSPLPEYLDPAILIKLEDGEHVTKTEIAKRIQIASKDLINFGGKDDTWKNIARWLNNYNEEFCRNEKNLWSERSTKSFKRISFYINKTQNSYKSSIDGAMKRLQDMGLIEYEEMRVIAIPKDYFKKIREIVVTDNAGVKALEGKVFPWIYETIVEQFENSDCVDWENELKLILKNFDMEDGTKRKASDMEEKFLDNISNEICRAKEYKDLKELLAASCWDISIRKDYFKKYNETLSEYNIKTFKGYHISNVNNDVLVDMNAVRELNTVFYEQRLKSQKDSLEKEFEKEWNKTRFLKDKGRIGYKYDHYNKNFEEFADKFIKVS